jgi:hypothetical protein
MIESSVLFQNKFMAMLFTKNVQFSRLVKADGTLREFNFRKHSDSQGGILFSVDVCDLRNNRIVFKMQHKETAWKIVQTPLPEWVIKNEHVLNDLIEEELRNAS